MMNRMVKLDVGGRRYKTSKTTLISRPGTMLERMFSGELSPSTMDEEGWYFIDRDGKVFGHILNFLRSGFFPPSTLPAVEKELIGQEALFYGIPELEKWAGAEKRRDDRRISFSTLKKIENTTDLGRTINLDLADFSRMYLAGWRCAHRMSLIKSTFENADLQDAHFKEVDFTSASFKGANLQGACFEKCLIKNVDFSGACLGGCSFEGSTFLDTDLEPFAGQPVGLARVHFEKARFEGLDCAGWDLSGACLEELDLRGTGLAAARLEGVLLNGANMAGLDLEGANLKGAAFGLPRAGHRTSFRNDAEVARTVLAGCRFRGCNLEGTSFIRVDLSGVDFQGANMNLTVFSNARAHLMSSQGPRFPQAMTRAEGADFRGCALRGAVLDFTNLAGANFAGAAFSPLVRRATGGGGGGEGEDGGGPGGSKEIQTRFRGVNLAGAGFAGADLARCSFEDANLSQCDFRGADLTGCQFVRSNRNGADFQGARMEGHTVTW